MQLEKPGGCLSAFGRLMQKAGCVLLSAALVFTWCVILPQGGWADEGATSQYDYILNPDNPSSYDPENTINPYTNNKSDFMLMEQNELLVLQSWDNSSNTKKWLTMTDNYTLGGEMHIAGNRADQADKWESHYGTSSLSGPNLKYQDAVAFDPNGTGRKDHVAFVGYCAEDNNSYESYTDDSTEKDDRMREKFVYLWVYDTVNKTSSPACRIGGWNDFSDDDMSNLLSSNFFNITAGDYNDDGKDTIVVFVPNDACIKTDKVTRDVCIEEYEYNGKVETGKSPFKKLGSDEDRGQRALHQVYLSQDETIGNMRSSASSGERGYVQNMLGCHLATGDFDGDGVDDLGVISYGQEYENLKTESVKDDGTVEEIDTDTYADYRLFTPMVAAIFGESDARLRANGSTVDEDWSSWSILTKGTMQTEYIALDGSKDSAGAYIYDSMRSPSISAGDTNGDGVDELIAAGYWCSVKDDAGTGSYEKTSDCAYYEIATACISRFDIGVSGSKESHSNDKMGMLNMQFSIWNALPVKPQLSVQCAATNGQGLAENLFIEGTLYEYSEEKGSYVSLFMETGINKIPYMGYTWVSDAVSGVFDGNNNGREQVMYIRGYKFNDTFCYQFVSLGGKTYDEATNMAIDYYESNVSSYDFTIGTKDSRSGKKSSENLSVTLAAVDNDCDGVKARYAGSDIIYNDPEVAAVLQGAPYFKDVDDKDGYSDSGQTTYTMSTTYERGKTSGDSVSFGAGIVTTKKTSLLAAVESELRAGYSLDWNQSFEESVATTYSTTLTAQKEDQVVISRVPVTVYKYDLYQKTEDGKEAVPEDNNVDSGKATYEVSVPGKPTYFQLSIKDYNEFVDTYNNQVIEVLKEKLKNQGKTDGEISKAIEEYDALKLEIIEQGANGVLPSDTRGNPSNYWSDSSLMGYGKTLLSQSPIALTYSGGSGTSEWNTAVTKTESTEMSHGFSFDYSLSVGGGILGNSVTVGGYVSLQYLHSSGSFKSNISENGASGTVQNIDGASLADAGLSDEVIRAYGFSWQFYMWKRALMTGSGSNTYTPIFGYRVYNVTMPADAPSNLTADLSETDAVHSVDLSWDAVSNVVTDPTDQKVERVKGYNVYAAADGGEYEKLNSALITGTNFTATGLGSNADYSFVVTTVFLKDAKGGGAATVESLYSPEAQITTPRQGYPVTLEVDEGLDVAMTCGGNEIASGSSVFEGDAVTVKVKPDALHTLKKVTVTKGNGDEADITDVVFNQSNEFCFAVSDATNVKIESALVVGESTVYFRAHSSYDNGKVAATCNGEQLKSGQKATGTVTLTATPDDGYILWGWECGGQYKKTDGSATFDFTPYESNHTIQAIFVEDAPTAPTGVTAVSSDIDAYHSVELSWDAVNLPYMTGYNVYLVTDDGYTQLNNSTITGTKFTACNLKSNTSYSFVVAAVGSRKTPGGTESTLSSYSKEAGLTTPRQSYSIELDIAKGLTATAACNGNEIASGAKVREGDAITVVVTVKQGYSVKQVTLNKGDGEQHDMTSADGKFTFVVTGDAVVTATANKNVDESCVSYQAQGNGSVTATCEGLNFKSGAVVESDVEFEATPNKGYALQAWLIVAVDNGDTNIHTIAANGSTTYTLTPFASELYVTAVFVEETDPSVASTVTVNQSANGSVKVIDYKGNVRKLDDEGKISVLKGTKVTFVATPNTHYKLKAWGGDLSGMYDNQTTVECVITDDLIVSAEFYAPVKYKVTYSSADESMGTVTGTVKSGSKQVEDTRVTFTATPVDGYRLSSWTITEGGTTKEIKVYGTKASYERAISVRDTTDVVAIFVKVEEQPAPSPAPTPTVEKCGVSVLEPAGGSITLTDALGNDIESGAKVEKGTVLTVVATADDGWELSALKADNAVIDNRSQVTVDQTITFSAEFVRLLDDGNGQAANGVELVLPYASAAFTGYAIEPGATLTVDGAELPSGAYALTYKDNTEPGIATVTATGKGTYKGSVSATFQITEDKTAYASAINEGLKLRMKGKKLLLNFGEVSVAQGYDVYVAKANGAFGATPKATGVTVASAAKALKAKSFNKKKAYKVQVVAYSTSSGQKRALATSYVLYVAGSNNACTNAVKIKGVSKTVAIKVGKSCKLKAKVKAANAKKRLLSKKLVKALRYYSSDTSVAKVTSKGKIKGVSAGTCTVTVMAANGIAKTVKVTVK